MISKTLHRKQETASHRNEVNSGAPEGKVVPSPLVAPHCITLIKTSVISDGRGEGKGPIF